MSVNYAAHFNTKQTPQSQPIPGKKQELNNASGYSFVVTPWEQTLRFLILGSEGGTYYVSENVLSAESAANTVKCIQEDSDRVVDMILDVSTNGRAAKQDATIFALALACTFAPEDKKPKAYAAIERVCRTGTYLFTFLKYVQSLRGWSRGLRNGVAKFYLNKSLEQLELQVIKYRNREGFTHRDALRLSHPSTKDLDRNLLFKYAVEKATEGKDFAEVNGRFKLINAYERAKTLDPKTNHGVKALVKIIQETGLPREGLPTTFLGKSEVWEAMLPTMPINALVRNLGKISSLEMTHSNLSSATLDIVTKLSNKEAILKSRIHPMQLLVALKMYSAGRGDKGSLAWKPNTKIVDSLNEAFYTSFGNVEASGKNTMLALDVSGSMDTAVSGTSVLSCREAAAAMSMITARTEPKYDIIGFTAGGKGYSKSKKPVHTGWDYGVSQLSISPSQRLDDIVKYTRALGFGGTDCSLPMLYAMENKIPVDLFVIYTDNETWAGNIHPKQALDQYRQKMGRPAKLVTVAMTASKFTIADPSDSGMMDVVGFDTVTPSVISQFASGF